MEITISIGNGKTPKLSLLQQKKKKKKTKKPKYKLASFTKTEHIAT